MRHFRFDRIYSIRLENQSFVRKPTFNLEQHAAQSFGSFQSDAEYGEVVWRFLPAAKEVARSFVFHPEQEVAEEADGSLVMKFHTSGHLEMACHLYCWGDAVEVIAPVALRELVAHNCRQDFLAFA
jgi:predicted DNA-binding transcriptional regulator YafY